MFDISDPTSLVDFIEKSKFPLNKTEQDLIAKTKEIPGVNTLSVYDLYILTTLAWQVKGYLRCANQK